MPRIEGDAQARGDREGLLGGRPSVLGDGRYEVRAQGAGLTAVGMGREDRELVASQTGEKIAIAEASLEQAR